MHSTAHAHAHATGIHFILNEIDVTIAYFTEKSRYATLKLKRNLKHAVSNRVLVQREKFMTQ